MHRDLKPENIMVSEDNFAKVVDFGLAKHVPGFAADRSGEHLTEEGVCVGTAGYMAPEQVHGLRDMDGRVDIFALGCILYEAIARESPFDGDSPIDTMHRILYHEPPPLRDGAINVIVRRCLAKDRSARYASMRELAADLRNAMAAAPRIATGAISRRPAISSIAVLPFHNRSGNEEMVFLSDGIPEDIVRDLGRIPALRVISSSSASRFRDTTDPQQAARELNVEAVLVGGLRVVAGMVVLDAELVKAADGTALWGKRYTRKLTDIIALEQEIAADLCGEVRLKVAPPASRAPDAEAHEAYLRGQREMGKDTADGLKQGIEYLHRAIEIDPEYALPYAALAMVYSRLIRNGMAPTRDSMHQAVALAHKALALDETLPEAHWPLAVAARIRGDIAEYERLSARVLELNPNFAAAYIDQEVVHALTGRYEEMDAAYQRARMLDPLSSRVMIVHASLLVFMRQYDHALEVLRAATEQFPESPNGAAYLAFATSYTDPEAALGMIDQLRMDTNPMFEMWKGAVLARAGRVAEARVIADRTDELAKSRYVQTYYRAVLRCQLGDHDAAFALMEQGVREGEWWFCWLPFDALLDPLRSDPRFAVVMENSITTDVARRAV